MIFYNDFINQERLGLQAKRDTYQMEINTENQKIGVQIYHKALQYAGKHKK